MPPAAAVQQRCRSRWKRAGGCPDSFTTAYSWMLRSRPASSSSGSDGLASGARQTPPGGALPPFSATRFAPGRSDLQGGEDRLDAIGAVLRLPDDGHAPTSQFAHRLAATVGAQHEPGHLADELEHLLRSDRRHERPRVEQREFRPVAAFRDDADPRFPQVYLGPGRFAGENQQWSGKVKPGVCQSAAKRTGHEANVGRRWPPDPRHLRRVGHRLHHQRDGLLGPHPLQALPGRSDLCPRHLLLLPATPPLQGRRHLRDHRL